MLIGEHVLKITDKNRLVMPKKFRELLGPTIVLSKGYEKCLLVMSTAQWEEVAKIEIVGSFVSSITRDISRFFLSSSIEVELDDQGRFVIPEYLKEYAEFKNSVSVLGLYNRIEIWDNKAWEKQRSKLEKQIKKTAIKLDKNRN